MDNWRMVALILFTTLVTAGVVTFAGFMAWGQNAVSAREVRQIVAEGAPYIEDRQRVLESVENVEQLTEQIAFVRMELARQTETLRGMQANLARILDSLFSTAQSGEMGAIPP